MKKRRTWCNTNPKAIFSVADKAALGAHSQSNHSKPEDKNSRDQCVNQSRRQRINHSRSLPRERSEKELIMGLKNGHSFRKEMRMETNISLRPLRLSS